MSSDSPWYDIWQQTTLSVTAAVALVGFLRGLEQRKDSNFRDVARDLADSDSPVLRASAAAQLDSYAAYRRYLLFARPYRRAAFMLTISALKRPDEHKQVRQQLAYCLKRLVKSAPSTQDGPVDLIDAQLTELILHHFCFDGCDLTAAQLQRSDLGNATFVGAKLWRAQLCNSRCSGANFAKAKLWDANFSNANLENANFLNSEINEGTNFSNASLANAALPESVRSVATRQGAKNL